MSLFIFSVLTSFSLISTFPLKLKKSSHFTFQRSFSQSVLISGKKRQWKGLKQIIAQEAQEPCQSVSYNSIDAPPSFKPAKKYSDISGLEANYTGTTHQKYVIYGLYYFNDFFRSPHKASLCQHR